jgi:hypothetical protein
LRRGKGLLCHTTHHRRLIAGADGKLASRAMGQCMARGTEVEQVDIVEWSRAHPAIKIRGAKIKMTTNDYAFRCAVGDLSMADGQHFCEFTVVDGYTLKLGVVRSGYGELTNGKSAHMKDPHLEPEHCASCSCPVLSSVCSAVSQSLMRTAHR